MMAWAAALADELRARHGYAAFGRVLELAMEAATIEDWPLALRLIGRSRHGQVGALQGGSRRIPDKAGVWTIMNLDRKIALESFSASNVDRAAS